MDWISFFSNNFFNQFRFKPDNLRYAELLKRPFELFLFKQFFHRGRIKIVVRQPAVGGHDQRQRDGHARGDVHEVVGAVLRQEERVADRLGEQERRHDRRHVGGAEQHDRPLARPDVEDLPKTRHETAPGECTRSARRHWTDSRPIDPCSGLAYRVG